MNKKGAKILNALTIVGYVFVGIYSVCAIWLIILLAIGYFNPNSTPPTGLKFDTTEQVVISENGGTATLTVYDINAELVTNEDGTQSMEDNTSSVEITLSVRDEANSLVNNIIKLPDGPVMTGESFEITAVTIDEIYNGVTYTNNVGGDCYLVAEAVVNGVPLHSERLPIFVDVPIQTFELTAFDPVTNEVLDLTQENFIFNDSIQLQYSVFPERALNPHTNGTNITKQFLFSPEEATIASVNASSGLVTITYEVVSSGEQEVTEPILTHITATVSPTYENRYQDNELITIEQTCSLNVYPVQLDEIIIQNEDYADERSEIDVTLFDNTNQFSFSVVDTGLPNVVNLDLFLKPLNSDEHSVLLDNQITRGEIEVSYFSTLETPLRQAPVNIYGTDTNSDGTMDYWTIEPLRVAEVNEEIFITITLNGNENKSISRLLNIGYNLPDSIEFVSSDSNHPIENNQLNIDITKFGGGTDDISTDEIVRVLLDYNALSTQNMTFTKIVFFVNTENNVNTTGSQIINVNENGELLNYNGLPLIEARGAGQISITPYVVRTDKDGVPVDCYYNQISSDTVEGFVWYNGLAPITEENHYIVYREYSPLVVNITELLDSLTIYTSDEFTEENMLTSENNNALNPLRIGTEPNTFTLYAVPNSPLALPRNNFDYNNWSNTIGQIRFIVTKEPGSAGELVVSNDSSNIKFYEVGEGADYNRYFTFEIYTTDSNDVSAIFDIELFINSEETFTSLRNDICISAEYIPVSTISITENAYIDRTDPQNNNIKFWELSTYVDPIIQTYSTNNQNYARVYWRNNDGSEIVLPGCTYSASSEWANRGFQPSYTESPAINFYAFDLTTTWDFSDVGLGEMNIVQIIALRVDASTTNGQAILEKKRQVINELISQTTANEYARVENIRQDDTSLSTPTIQFRKELPTGFGLFMAYSINDERSTAIPDFVQISYSFPNIHFFDDKSINATPDEDGNYVLDSNNTEIYFYQANATYILVSLSNYSNGVFDFSTNSVNDEYADEFLSTYTNEVSTSAGNLASLFAGDTNYFNFVFSSDYNYNNQQVNNFKISLNTDRYTIQNGDANTPDTVYKITVTRSINLALSVYWTDELWSDPSSLNNNWGSYLNDTVTVESTFTINIIVKNGEIVEL